MDPLQSLLGAMAFSAGDNEDLSEAEAEMKLALEEACQEAGVTLSPAMSPKALCVLNYRENMPGVGKVAGWLRSTRHLRKTPAFQRIASQRRCKSAEDLLRMLQVVSEEHMEIVGQAMGPPTRLPSRLQRGNSEPETGQADFEDGESGESTPRPMSPLSPSNILERLGTACTLDVSSGRVDWTGLAGVYRTEHADETSDSTASDGIMEIKINSGGVVYFAAFQYPKRPDEQTILRRVSLNGAPVSPIPGLSATETTSHKGAGSAYGSQGIAQPPTSSHTDIQATGTRAPLSSTEQSTGPRSPASNGCSLPPFPLHSPAVLKLSSQAGSPPRTHNQGPVSEAGALRVRLASSDGLEVTGSNFRPPSAFGASPESLSGQRRRATISSPPARQPPVEIVEYAACIKFGASRLATQSERLGSELARHLGVATPQARVIHSGSEEWEAIQAAVETAKSRAADKLQVLATRGQEQTPAYTAAEDEERTCEELLDALRIFRCLLLMGYVHGKSLKDSPAAFESPTEQEATAAALGRILVLDLLLRNEDRLCIKRLGWQENAGNLRYTEQPFIIPKTPAQLAAQSAAVDDAAVRARSKAKAKTKPGSKLRVGVILETEGPTIAAAALHKRSFSAPDVREIQEAERVAASRVCDAARGSVVVIDSSIPRRPPAAKMEADRENFPKLMELLLCDSDVAAEILHEISSGHLLKPAQERKSEDGNAQTLTDPAMSGRTSPPPLAAMLPRQILERRVVESFQRGVREGVDALHALRPLLSRLHQRLDGMLRAFMACIGEVGRAEQLRQSPKSQRRHSGAGVPPSPDSRKPPSPRDSKKLPSPRDARKPPSPRESKTYTPPGAIRTSAKSSPRSDNKEPSSPLRGSPLRFTIRLKDWQKVAKMDDAVSEMLEEWDGKLRQEAATLCEAHGFVTGFLEWAGGHSLVDSYELKVRLEHMLERVGLILTGAEAQRPSQILPYLFVGGVASARSCHLLQHMAITHVVNMAPEDTLGEDGHLGEFPDCFHYTHCQARDTQSEDIGRFFAPVSDLINQAAASGGKVLVHCFEGKSRSVAVVLAYLMLHKSKNLAQAWAEVKAAHPRAAPNDGFAQALVQLDKRLNGQVASMEWRGKKPTPRLCPLCGKSTGVSTDSLRIHLRKSHPEHKNGLLPPLAN